MRKVKRIYAKIGKYEHVSAKVFAIDLKGFIAFMVPLGHFVPHHIITMLR